MTELAILIPVLGRPQRVKPTVESIRTTAPGALIVFVADEEDLKEITAVKRQSGSDVKLLKFTGNYAAKINHAYENTDEPLLFMAADDLKFWPEWFQRAQKYLEPGIDVVGTNDICNPRVMTGAHSTHTFFRRSYIEEQSGVIDEPDKVLNECYYHEYTDDEFIQTAKFRKVYAHGWDVIVEHLHPLVEKAKDDKTYQKGRAHTRLSRKMFQRRQRLWREPKVTHKRPTP